MDAGLLDKRTEILKARLIQITAEHHKKFLETIGEKSYDPFKYKTWHHQFKVHALELDMAEKRLKEKPTMRRCQGVGEFLKQNNVKDQLIKAALEEVAKATEAEKISGTSQETTSDTESSCLKGLLSDDLIRKVCFTIHTS